MNRSDVSRTRSLLKSLLKSCGITLVYSRQNKQSNLVQKLLLIYGFFYTLDQIINILVRYSQKDVEGNYVEDFNICQYPLIQVLTRVIHAFYFRLVLHIQHGCFASLEDLSFVRWLYRVPLEAELQVGNVNTLSFIATPWFSESFKYFL